LTWQYSALTTAPLAKPKGNVDLHKSTECQCKDPRLEDNSKDRGLRLKNNTDPSFEDYDKELQSSS